MHYSKVIGPVFEKLSDQFENIGFFKCDVDSQEEVAAEVGIKAMPTFLLYKNGEQIGKVVGADPNKLRVSCFFFFSSHLSQHQGM